MKLFKKFTLVLAVVVLCSAMPAKVANYANEEIVTKNEVSVSKKDEKASKVTYKELKEQATALKGSKLSFKEKIALKFLQKKLNKEGGNSGAGKSQLIALLLAFFVGGLGIHRFYLGYTWQGIVQLLTLGGCGIWSLIDFIRIITGDLKPKDGSYDKTL